MILVNAELAHGRLTVHIEGHEDQTADGRVCAAVSAISHTALLGLAAIAEQYPDVVQVHVTELEEPCPP